MLNSHLLSTDSDRMEARARERRQRAEAERCARIFNNKYRKIGVDVHALEIQMKDRQTTEQLEKEWERTIAKQMHNDDQLAILLEEREKEEKVLIGKELDTFRKQYQRKEDTREFDINDPAYLKKQIPPRTSDSEDIGLPTGQRFEGEDLRKNERECVMKQQASSWLHQQMEERRNYERELKNIEYIEKRAAITQDMRALQLELMERNCQKMIESANDRYNKALAEERKKIKLENLENECQDDQAEMYNTLTSDLMTENPVAANSLYGPHRVVPYMYKGMSREQIAGIKMAQSQQIVDKTVRKDIERQMDNNWHDFEKSLSTMASNCNDDTIQKRRLAAARIQMENFELAQLQKEKQKYIDKIVYSNKVTEDFFKNFNNSSR